MTGSSKVFNSPFSVLAKSDYPGLRHDFKDLISRNDYIMSFNVFAYRQSSQELIGQAAKIDGEAETFGSGFLGGFLLWGLVGGVIFGGRGFVVFVYGKKHFEFRLMMVGVVLMAYPYFLQGTIFFCLVGILLMAALYFFRE